MRPSARFILAIVLTVLLAACGPGATPVPTAPQTQVPEVGGATPTALPPIELITLDLSGPKAGTEMLWVDGGSLVFVPGGEYQRGAGGADNPLQTLTVSPFWIHRTKVTNRMYRLCVSVGVCLPPAGEQAASELLDSYLADRPVVDVTWKQAQAYCEWVTGRLPTEAEWELTARGTDSLIYPWGDAAPDCDLLNFDNCLGKTSRVFDYLNARSPYNALDMAGNAFEWTGDWYDNDYYPNGPDVDPLGPRVGTERVVRGSSFASNASKVPSAVRFHESPNEARPDLGFRCVVVEPQAYAPYCESTAFVPGDPGSPPPGLSCDVDVREIGRDCGLVTHEITHTGVPRAVRGAPPLSCEIAGENRITCTGPASTTALVTVAVNCGEIPPDSMPDPRCLSDYEDVPGLELHCSFVPRPEPREEEEVDSGDCPPGMVERPGPGGLTLCITPFRPHEEPVLEDETGSSESSSSSDSGALELGPDTEGEGTGGCPSRMEPVVGEDGTVTCRGTTADGTTVECPAGTIPMLTTEGVYCFGTGGRMGEPCPPGTYAVDGGRFCIGAARTGSADGAPAEPCIEGFTFDAAMGCCSSPTATYPGCGAGEYHDTVHGCTTPPESSGAILTLITFNASTGACGGPGGDNPCSPLDKTTCYATPGCTWDDGGSFCH